MSHRVQRSIEDGTITLAARPSHLMAVAQAQGAVASPRATSRGPADGLLAAVQRRVLRRNQDWSRALELVEAAGVRIGRRAGAR